MATDSEIQIARDSGFYTDRGRAYKVLVDGEEAGDVRQGETKSFTVEAGSHEVQMKIDWCRSRPVAVDAAPGTPARLGCRPAARPWSVLWYTTFGRSRYIELDDAAASAPAASPTAPA